MTTSRITSGDESTQRNGSWIFLTAHFASLSSTAYRPVHFSLQSPDEQSGEAVCRRVGALLDLFGAQECANYIKNAGFVSI